MKFTTTIKAIAAASLLAGLATAASASSVTITDANTNCDYGSAYFYENPDLAGQAKSRCWLTDGDTSDDFDFDDTPLIAIVNPDGTVSSETGQYYDGDPFPAIDLTDLIIQDLGGGSYKITYDGPLVVTMIGLKSANEIELYKFVSGETYTTFEGKELSNLGIFNGGVIPLPAAGWLMIGGLGGLVALRRKRKA